jgi:acetyl-CoA carboxylase carboxyltransferase component
VDLYRRHRASGPKLADNRPYTDGVVAGSGTVDGRRVFVYAQDFTIFGGSLGEAHAAKIHKVMDLAIATGAPLIGLNDSGGARIQEGAMALHGYGGIFSRHVQASGIIPQISVILGPCAGGAAYSPALADFTFMVKDIAKMYLTGPDVVYSVTGERVSHEDLGGTSVHGGLSGTATFVHDDEESCLEDVRYLVSMLPSNYLDPAPNRPPNSATTDLRPRLAEIVPAEPNLPYDMRDVIVEVVDDGDFLELHEAWARNVICALARIEARWSASSPTSRWCWPGCWTSPRRRRRPGSCGSVTRSASRWSRWSTCPASCPARTRSTPAPSGTAPSCCTRTARRPCRASR